MNRGTSLIELVLYTGILSVVLLIFYQLFAFGGAQKARSIVQNELYGNADTIFFDLRRTISGATSIDEPVLGATSNALQLNGGSIVYAVNGNNELVKTEAGATERLTNNQVIVSSLSFTHLGPSTDSPSIAIDVSLEARHTVEGGYGSASFESGVTVR